MDWIKRIISDCESSEIAAENELKTAVDNKRWSEVLRLAQRLCEYRTTRCAIEIASERIEKDNKKEVL